MASVVVRAPGLGLPPYPPLGAPPPPKRFLFPVSGADSGAAVVVLGEDLNLVPPGRLLNLCKKY